MLSLEQYKTYYPLPEEWTQKGKPVEYFFSLEVDTPISDIWLVVSDTSRMNQAMGFGPMEFAENSEGKKIGTRCHGSGSMANIF